LLALVGQVGQVAETLDALMLLPAVAVQVGILALGVLVQTRLVLAAALVLAAVVVVG
jgi:hypothetical protein